MLGKAAHYINTIYWTMLLCTVASQEVVVSDSSILSRNRKEGVLIHHREMISKMNFIFLTVSFFNL